MKNKIDSLEKSKFLLILPSSEALFTLDPESDYYTFESVILNRENELSYNVGQNYQAIFFVVDSGENIEINNSWAFVVQAFKNTPIILWSNDLQDLNPSCGEAPFFKIKKKNLNTFKIQAILRSMREFSLLNAGHSQLMQEVSATTQIADLNIDRLYKTLKELETSRDLSKASEIEKQTFLASVTHELRTPLNTILGFTDLFDTSNLNEEQAVNINSIKQASRNLLDIVNDVLSISKIKEGKLSILKEAFNLQEEIEMSFGLLNNRATEKGIKYNVKYNFNVDKNVFGDKMRLNQVLTNLLTNALKFTKNGEVKLTVSNPLDDIIIFTISDSGIGISPDKIETIFDGYSQAEKSTSHEYGGTGLGLSLVKKIIELQDGKIEVESRVGVGSVFSFQLSLPEVVRLDKKTKTLANMRTPDLSKLKILAIEDNQLNQLLLQRILSKKVHLLTICGDGESAIIKSKQQAYDAILVDLHLPKLNGLETVAEIRKSELNKNTPVSIVTASIWEKELKQIESAGIKTIIHKPYTPSNLMLTIERMVVESKINFSHINKIAEKDESFKIKILQSFIENNKKDVALLLEMNTKNNPEGTSELAHKIKSSLSILGLEDLKTVCENIEKSPSKITKEDFLKFSKQCEESRINVQNWLDLQRS